MAIRKGATVTLPESRSMARIRPSKSCSTKFPIRGKSAVQWGRLEAKGLPLARHLLCARKATTGARLFLDRGV